MFRDETIKPEKAGCQWKTRCQLASNLYCIGASAVTGTVMPTVKADLRFRVSLSVGMSLEVNNNHFAGHGRTLSVCL